MKNALIRLREHYHELASAERTVAEYILKNPETASTLSVQELAHKSRRYHSQGNSQKCKVLR